MLPDWVEPFLDTAPGHSCGAHGTVYRQQAGPRTRHVCSEVGQRTSVAGVCAKKRQRGQRIDPRAVDCQRPMQMRSGHPAGRADAADRLARDNAIALRYAAGNRRRRAFAGTSGSGSLGARLTEWPGSLFRSLPHRGRERKKSDVCPNVQK
jgi:hypothetical protein